MLGGVYENFTMMVDGANAMLAGGMALYPYDPMNATVQIMTAEGMLVQGVEAINQNLAPMLGGMAGGNGGGSGGGFSFPEPEAIQERLNNMTDAEFDAFLVNTLTYTGADPAKIAGLNAARLALNSGPIRKLSPEDNVITTCVLAAERRFLTTLTTRATPPKSSKPYPA